MIRRALKPFQQFFATEAASGVVLLACTVIALVWANSPWGSTYAHLWDTRFSVSLGDRSFTHTLHQWINDGLMVVFFLLVGLEIKRELLVGELASARQAALPVAAALGGMIVPAVIYIGFNGAGTAARGWAIPVATDIAFALGVLALLGSRVPPALKVFLAALAIADDIGAVLVIAIFYTASLSGAMLAVAGGILVGLIILNRAGVDRLGVYLSLGVALWIVVLASGVHATVAGVLLAMAIPARTRIDEDEFIARARGSLSDFERASSPERHVISNPQQQDALHMLRHASDSVEAPLRKAERALHTTVAFVIMPLFALANAGVVLSADTWSALEWRIVWGVALGLFVGKPIGIAVASLAARRFGIAQFPSAMTRTALVGVGWLGGIGFTMSLFIATLAFGSGTQLDSAKVGILSGSLVSGVVGWTFLRRLAGRN